MECGSLTLINFSIDQKRWAMLLGADILSLQMSVPMYVLRAIINMVIQDAHHGRQTLPVCT